MDEALKASRFVNSEGGSNW